MNCYILATAQVIIDLRLWPLRTLTMAYSTNQTPTAHGPEATLFPMSDIHPSRDVDRDSADNDDFKWVATEDQKDMHRMNKVQELRRNFRFLSIIGYSVLLGDTWVIPG